ncbi:unnamed protein product [Coccothraustes coccothraustes]
MAVTRPPHFDWSRRPGTPQDWWKTGPPLPPPLTSYEPIHKNAQAPPRTRICPSAPLPQPRTALAHGAAPRSPRHGTGPQEPLGKGNSHRGISIPGKEGLSTTAQLPLHPTRRGAGNAVPSGRPLSFFPGKIQGQRRLPEIFLLSCPLVPRLDLLCSIALHLHA